MVAIGDNIRNCRYKFFLERCWTGGKEFQQRSNQIFLIEYSIHEPQLMQNKPGDVCPEGRIASWHELTSDQVPADRRQITYSWPSQNSGILPRRYLMSDF